MIYFQATANTASVTSPVTTSTQFSCLSSAITPSSSISEPTLPISPPTAVPPPPIDAKAQILVDDLSTIILYAELIGNDGNLAKLCSALNPAALFNETGINGTAVQNEVCSAAAIAKYLPGLAQTVVLENQSGVSFLQAALFAVQVLGRFGSCTDRATLCKEIDETLINNLSIGFVEKTGTAVKQYVCSMLLRDIHTAFRHPVNIVRAACECPTDNKQQQAERGASLHRGEEKKTISGRPAVVDNDVTWEVMMSSIAPCSRNEGHSDIVSVSSPWANRLAVAVGSTGLLSLLFGGLQNLPLVAFMFIFPAFGISAAGEQHYRQGPVISAAGDQHYRQEPVITTPIQPYVDNPWAVIRFPGRFPPPGNNSLVPRLRRGPSPDPAMYSLRVATPSRLSGRIQHYGPVTPVLEAQRWGTVVGDSHPGSDFSGHDSAASDDGSEDNAGDKVWANRSTTPVEELDVAAWAEAAMVSQANTIAENQQLAMQQSASIARLQAAVENQDGVIAAQADATRVLQLAASKHEAEVEELRRELAVAKEQREGFRSRCLRGAFACADQAKKQSEKAKELEEELQAEKVAREADARTAQEVLAATQQQSEAEMATVVNNHQTVVSNSTASQSQAEARIRELEGQVRASKQVDSERCTIIKELKQQLDTSKARLLGQAPFFERKYKEAKHEKEQLSSSLAATAQQLKEANDKVKDLEVTDEYRVAALEDCAEESEEKDAKIEGLEAEKEELNGVLAERATELSSLKATHEILEAMHKQAQSSMMTLQYSAQKNVSERDTKIAELDAANKKTQLENAALIVTINAERAQHQERHEEDIRSLQRDVFSQDQRLRSFENEVAALRSELAKAVAAAAAAAA
ncbi:MAG: hypothetical protein L6R36_002278, partial [Xanthoria steineri]